jgi:hypothetical protein
MKLRVRVPFHTYMTANNLELLQPETRFGHGDYDVSVSLSGGVPFKSEDSQAEEICLRMVESIAFEVSGGHEMSSINELVIEPDSVGLIRVLAPIINRVVRAIRNYGYASHIEEIRPTDSRAEQLLKTWKAEISDGSDDWKPLSSSWMSPMFAVLFGSDPSEPGSLVVERWPVIEEAIQDNLEPGPERELLANSLQHLRGRNYRLALLEAVICLDIALNGFLRQYLSIGRSFSETRINRVLNSQTGLTTRVGLLLELVLDPNEVKEAKIDDVLRAVKMRNHIVHQTGRLPDAIDDDSLTDAIWATLDLAQVLGSKKFHLDSTPEANLVASKISETRKVTVRELRFLQNHRVTVSIYTGVRPPSLSDEELLAIVQDIKTICATRDPRFVPEVHLSVKFLRGLIGAYAIWANGQLERVPNAEGVFRPIPIGGEQGD